MKIVVVGDDRTYRVTCNECQSIIDYKYSEIPMDKDRLGFDVKADWVSCPVCQEPIDCTESQEITQI